MPQFNLRAMGNLTIIPILMVSLTACTSTFEVHDLKVCGMTNPIGIDVTPVFQWRMQSEEEGLSQTAYELTVRDREGNKVWESGRVESAEPYGIVYEGNPLQDCAEYTWQVTVHDNKGGQATSEEQSFRMGVTDTSFWSAEWIDATCPRKVKKAIANPFAFQQGDSDEASPETQLDSPLYFRKAFSLDKPVTEIVRATAYASAHGIYDLYIDGERVSEELAPGFTTYSSQTEYQQYDITRLMKDDENVAAAIVADGWWSGTWGIVGVGEQYGDRNALLCQIVIEYKDGSSQTVATGKDWRWSTGGYVYADLSEGVRFDARQEPVGWTCDGFDDSDWSNVRTADYGYSNLRGRRAEPVRVVRTIPAKRILHTSKGETVIDFGENIVGRVCANISGTEGQEVSFTHSEVLDEEGNFFRNIQGNCKGQRDVYVFADSQATTFAPRFTYHGFRYVLVDGLDDVEAKDFTAEVLATDMERAGSFSCSDNRLTQLQQNIFRSQQGNMLSIPTDCPHREKAGWTGDMQVYAPTAVYNMDVYAFLSRWLEGLRADQYEDGAVPDISPRPGEKAMLFPSRCSSAWGDACIIVPYRLYREYGRKEILTENYEMMSRWMDYIARRVELGEWTKDFHYGDWMAPNPVGNDASVDPITAASVSGAVVADAMYAYSASLMEEIATITGHDEDAVRYGSLKRSLRNQFAERYIADDGSTTPSLQGLYVLALAANLVPEDMKPLVSGKLVDDIRRMDNHLNVGFPSVPFLLDVLFDNGYEDVAWTLLIQDTAPSWLYEVAMGATTIWERWNGISPDGKPSLTSYNHFSFGCVGDFIYRRVLGLEATSPAYKTFVVRPWWGCGLTWAEGTHTSPYGEISVSWKEEGGHRELSVTVPPGAEATVYIENFPKTIGSGSHKFKL